MTQREEEEELKENFTNILNRKKVPLQTGRALSDYGLIR
jgi:hypothetical protein